MAEFVEALARVGCRVEENGKKRTYSWKNVKPSSSADDLNAVLDELMQYSNSTVLEKRFWRNLSIV